MTYGKIHTDGSRSGGQPVAPKLLTEAEARALWAGTFSKHGKTFAEYLAELRERGLIAPEPVDTLEAQAGELTRRYLETDDWQAYDLALAALKRGMELRPEWTRGMVRNAVIKAQPILLTDHHFDEPEGSTDRTHAEGFVDELLAALTGEQP